MKLYVVVIGKLRSGQRYIAYEPFSGGDNKNGRLAIYDNKKRAKEAKEEILKTCGHNDVFTIPISHRVSAEGR